VAEAAKVWLTLPALEIVMNGCGAQICHPPATAQQDREPRDARDKRRNRHWLEMLARQLVC
jgi:hypothetical protein